MRRRRRQRGRDDDIPGLATALTAPFIVASVAIICIWLVLNGLLTPTWAWVAGPLLSSMLIAGLPSLYRVLLDGPISHSGCLAGLAAYAGGIALAVILIWAMWPQVLTAALIGIILVPVLSFAAALVQSRREPRRRRRSSPFVRRTRS